jgi:hypothetical protein
MAFDLRHPWSNVALSLTHLVLVMKVKSLPHWGKDPVHHFALAADQSHLIRMERDLLIHSYQGEFLGHGQDKIFLIVPGA